MEAILQLKLPLPKWLLCISWETLSSPASKSPSEIFITFWVLSDSPNHELDMYRSNSPSNGSGICDKGLAGPKGTRKLHEGVIQTPGAPTSEVSLDHQVPLTSWSVPWGWCAEEENIGIVYIWFYILCTYRSTSCNIAALCGDILKRQSWSEICT